MNTLPTYTGLLAEIKDRIQTAQTRAVLAVNAELIQLYWQIGQLLAARQTQEGWGAGVIPRLAQDIRNELPEQKGFSERNLKLMVQFFRTYPTLFVQAASLELPASELPDTPETAAIGQPPVAQLDAGTMRQPLVAQLPWAHNVLLMQMVKDQAQRDWYAQQALAQGWSRNVLKMQIDSLLHQRQGAAVSNFATRLPTPQSDLAQQALKDPYIFDFLTLETSFAGKRVTQHRADRSRAERYRPASRHGPY